MFFLSVSEFITLNSPFTLTINSCTIDRFYASSSLHSTSSCDLWKGSSISARPERQSPASSPIATGVFFR